MLVRQQHSFLMLTRREDEVASISFKSGGVSFFKEDKIK